MSTSALDEDYASLCDYAYRIALQVVSHGEGSVASTSARYVLEESAKLVAAYTDGNRRRPDLPAAEALDAVVHMWPSIRDGEASGELIFARSDGLWPRLMNEWPMGHYAQMVATALAEIDGPLGTVVELGAGVGATTRRIWQLVSERSGRLIATDLQYSGSRAVDFDRPLLTQLPAADVVVATNALHCASDPAATLRWIHELLRPSGVLVLGEGAPFPQPNVPWALNLLFGVCRGWYDRGGFRSPEFWLTAMQAAGFREVIRTRWPSDRYELGGSFVARSDS